MGNTDIEKVNITGRKALLAWNRLSVRLEELGVEDAGTEAKRIVAGLVSENILEGEFYHSTVQKSSERHIKIKLLQEGAQAPAFSHLTDAGADLFSIEDVVIPAGKRAMVGTGIAIEIPFGFAGLVHPRSGLAAKHGLTVLNTPGTIDSGYRGEVKVILYNTTDEDYSVAVGDRIAQLVIQRHASPDFVVVDELIDADRGEGGFGSTGKGANA